MKKLGHYLSLIKFSHTIFALPFALTGYFMGLRNADAEPKIIIGILLCMVFARSAAMAFNRYLDREFDAKNPRTALREIPSGIISASSALRFTILNSVLFMGSAYFINITCFLLSPIALLVILGYSYTKRFTWLCHLVLGLGLSLAPAGAYIAVTNSIHIAIVLLSLAVMSWVSGFDIIYALQDDEFDKSEGLFSIPSQMGRIKALSISRFLHVCTVLLIMVCGYLYSMNFYYYIGALIFSLLLVYQQILVKPSDLSKVNLAFMTTNGVASIVFAACAITDMVIFG
ncbi:MAG: hypothetical protein RLZZ595_1149 [Bacteroidota bacterium]|jgi:4-hydroxybenzoate polyprenyltransferase